MTHLSYLLWQHLLERLHLNAVEDALGDVGVARDQRPDLGERVGLEDDQAAGAVEEGAGDPDAPGARQRVQVRQVRRPHLRALLARLGGVVADDHVEHEGHLLAWLEGRHLSCVLDGGQPVALGPAAASGVDEVERHLREGLAARKRGDPGAAVVKITRAMDLLAALAGHADAAEGAMMRAIAERFRQALARGALGEAKETADVMRARSGSVLAPKKPR